MASYQDELNARMDAKRPICPICGLPVEPADEVDIEWEGEGVAAHRTCSPTAEDGAE